MHVGLYCNTNKKSLPQKRLFRHFIFATSLQVKNLEWEIRQLLYVLPSGSVVKRVLGKNLSFKSYENELDLDENELVSESGIPFHMNHFMWRPICTRRHKETWCTTMVYYKTESANHTQTILKLRSLYRILRVSLTVFCTLSFQLIGIVFACCLMRSIKKEYEVM